MRSLKQHVVLAGFLSAAVLVPTFGNAQVPPAPVAPQSAEWLFNGEPMQFNGLVYYATRGTRFFDGGIMTQVGVYRSVPVFADVTQQQLSIVYVPVGRGLMRAYEVKPASDLGTLQAPAPFETPAYAGPDAVAPRLVSNPAPADIPRPTRMESIRKPEARNGVWLEYDGVRYYSDGPAQPFDASRFTRVGEYRGFPVFRASSGEPDKIWVAVATDESPVAPYKR